MKNFIYILISVFSLPFYLEGQINVPLFSEPGSITQRVGNTNFKIRYERPKANGRLIFGGLVPYNEVWRAGAGPCTKISFDTPVFINNQKISRGTYSVFTIPGKVEWTIILNADTTLYGAYDYKMAKDIVRVNVGVDSNKIWTETFNINVDVRNDLAVMRISWLNIAVALEIETRTYANLMTEVKDILENDYDLEQGKYTLAAEYIMHNKVGFGDDYLAIAEQLIDKAFLVEMENHTNYLFKRMILKIRNQKEEYIKFSKLQIKYLEAKKPYQGYEEDVIKIRDEIEKW